MVSGWCDIFQMHSWSILYQMVSWLLSKSDVNSNAILVVAWQSTKWCACRACIAGCFMLCEVDKWPSKISWSRSKLISLQCHSIHPKSWSPDSAKLLAVFAALWSERSYCTTVQHCTTWVNIILSRIKKASWFGATVWTGGIQKLILNLNPTVRKYKIQVYVPRHSIQTFHWQAHQQLSECLTECVIAISWLKNISLWQLATSSWSLCRRLRRLRDKTVETLFSKTMFSVN